MAEGQGDPREHPGARYVREAQRRLLWCNQERGKGLRERMVEDGTAYRGWVSQLGRLTPRGLGCYGLAGAAVGLDRAAPAYAAKNAAAPFEFLRQSGDLANPSLWNRQTRAAGCRRRRRRTRRPWRTQFVAGTEEQLAFVLDQKRLI